MENKKFKINLDDSAFNKERNPVSKPVTSLFKPSSKGVQGETSSAQTAPQTTGQPLSYAEFIVQSRSRGAQTAAPGLETQDGCRDLGSSRESVTKPSAHPGKPPAGRSEKEVSEPPAASVTPAAAPDPTVVSERQEEDLSEEKRKEEGQNAQLTVTPHQLGSGNSIIVSPRQRGNPILKFVRSVPWEFAEVVPDYVLGRTTCALFLSLRYHNLNPNYIHERLKQLGQTFTLRVLLVQVDVKDPHHALKELARICIMADCTLILAWSPEEAGRYLETYKSYEKKPADLLKEQVEKDYLSKVTDCLTTVKSVNKTDAITLLSAFSSLEGIINASKEELVLCPGLGPQKAKRLHDVLHQPFLKSKKKDS
ncbi:DNA excision repair protein ERCC-1 isoform X1 [Astyanax mexicanus]|uniref:DNA excision repair protein ERCC-1 isoform X1 n=1 Tax=Astyanax mexicanus TaxID=7994 RepID=UPI000BBD4D16|nr:DNA excision repair protein ERCC-1 isoform X1 [Astyanax mexicanus]